MHSFLQLAVTVLATVAALSGAVPKHHSSHGHGHGHSHHNIHRHTHAVRGTSSNTTDAPAGDFYLRVMALGASITYGFKSADGNGYRKGFRQALRARGWQVNMVGDVNAGNMKDNDNEGHPGFRVDQMMSVVGDSVPRWKPNVVLVNCGTNDAYQEYQINGTFDRMAGLLKLIWKTVPDTTVVLSTLLTQAKNPGDVESINAQYRALASSFQAQGRKLVLAEMDDGWIAASDLVDGVHPDAAGYMRMAARFDQAVQIANNKGWLTAPVAMGINATDEAKPEVDECRKTGTDGDRVEGSGQKGIKVLTGSSTAIVDDGPYVHHSESRGSLLSGTLGLYETIQFAQLVASTDVTSAESQQRSAALDDLVYTAAGQLYMRLNQGNGVFGEAVALTTNLVCDPLGLRFGDINGDGLDDCLCIGPDGGVMASVNRGQNPPAFSYVGVFQKGPGQGVAGGPYNRSSVRLADIDGDGRLDYCLTGPADGTLTCQRNGGTSDTPGYWEGLNSTTDPTTFVDRLARDAAGVRLADLNGDGRADWLWLDDNGRVTTMLNQRADGPGLRPSWWDMGVTHGGMNGPSRDMIRLARVFGSGRLDYVYFVTNTTNLGYAWDMRVWENTGAGGTQPKGDGVFFCDMDGSGTDDYVFVDTTGQLTIFRNPFWAPAPRKALTLAGWSWEEHRTVLQTGVDDRSTLQLADWTGNGRCDVIETNPLDGETYIWTTDYNPIANTFSFGNRTAVTGTAATSTTAAPFAACSESSGIAPDDLAVRYADINGDGYADYLCISPDGRTTAWLQDPSSSSPNSFVSIHQIVPSQTSSSSGFTRADMRFVDVDGDGRTDLLWLDRASGTASVWYSDGYNAKVTAATAGDNTWTWDRQSGPVLQGNDNAANLRWPNLAGRGRSDIVYVQPKTAQGWLTVNSCKSPDGAVGSDDGKTIDLGLPTPPDGGDVAVYLLP